MFKEAGNIYRELDMFEDAAQLYIKGKIWREAGQCFVKADKFSDAVFAYYHGGLYTVVDDLMRR